MTSTKSFPDNVDTTNNFIQHCIPFQNWLGSQLSRHFTVVGFSLERSNRKKNVKHRTLVIHVHSKELNLNLQVKADCYLEFGEKGITFSANILNPRWFKMEVDFVKERASQSSVSDSESNLYTKGWINFNKKLSA